MSECPDCKTCGGTVNRKNEVFCSDECKHEYWHQGKRAKHDKIMDAVEGSEYVTYQDLRGVMECSKNHIIHLVHEMSDNGELRIDDSDTPYKIRICNISFEDIRRGVESGEVEGYTYVYDEEIFVGLGLLDSSGEWLHEVKVGHARYDEIESMVERNVEYVEEDD